MEAPVPASALIHSATLVSAGVYLILRFYPILELSQLFYIVLPAIGAITAFIGGAAAMFQTDLKKILAYSTISHCGFLMFLASFGAFKFVLLYLFVHGFFKASAFLCVGNIIHHIKNYQDLRRAGSVYKFLPIEFFFLIFCLLNLSGLPFFFGFYIKSLLFLNTSID
jgi:NADH:ubiquinone oxidoreductase subunit 5 (subunit L)/multisubunit Na+/H+ antiporter MnhA subunit